MRRELTLPTYNKYKILPALEVGVLALLGMNSEPGPQGLRPSLSLDYLEQISRDSWRVIPVLCLMRRLDWVVFGSRDLCRT